MALPGGYTKLLCLEIGYPNARVSRIELVSSVLGRSTVTTLVVFTFINHRFNQNVDDLRIHEQMYHYMIFLLCVYIYIRIYIQCI